MDHVVTGIHAGITLIPLGDRLDFLLDMQMSLECQEHWFGVGILVIDNLCSIIFLLFESKLMLLDQIIFVVINGCKAENSVLDMVTHLLLVNVDSILGILY